MRTQHEIQAEITATFGFFPPMFLPVADNPQQLENFWQQTLYSYVQNPLPALFKEKLAAFLSRFCEVPYCIVCHSCALKALGQSGSAILSLLDTAPPPLKDMTECLEQWANQPPESDTLLAADTPEERLLIDAAALIFLEEDDGRLRSELRRFLPPLYYQNLIAFLAFVRTVHHWMQAHPEVAYDADQRAISYLPPLLEEMPRLSDFFHQYAAKVREEREIRQGRRRDAERLAESEQRYRSLIETAAQIVWRTDAVGNILEATGWTEFTGQNIENRMASVMTRMIHPDDRTRAVSEWWEAVRLGRPLDSEYRLRRHDGYYAYFSTYAVPIRRNDGTIREWIGTTTDIDQRKRTEQALQTEYLKQQRIADVLQRSLLTLPPADHFPGLKFAAVYEPANDEADIGGDFYDVVLLAQNRVALAVGDIAGKGLEAAAHTVEAKFTLRAYLHQWIQPAEVLRQLNTTFFQSAYAARQPFLCLTLALLDTENDTITFANAGAENPLIQRRDGLLEEITVGDIPLGAQPLVPYEQWTLPFGSGDTAVLMSDGVTESRRNGRLFGSEGIKTVLMAQELIKPPSQSLASLSHLGRLLLEEARAFGGGQFADDACLLLARKM